jgi:hypothetical protein
MAGDYRANIERKTQRLKRICKDCPQAQNKKFMRAWRSKPAGAPNTLEPGKKCGLSIQGFA